MTGDRRDAVSDIADRGYAVVPAVLDQTAIERCCAGLEAVFAAEADIARERAWLTASYRVAYVLPAKHPTFLDLCRPGPLAALAARVLGRDCVIAGFNGLAMVPRGATQALHRDHPDPTPGSTLYLHAVVALDPFTARNGATRIVPGSHRIAATGPATGSSSCTAAAFAHLEGEAVHVELPAGACLVYDAACVHAGSANSTDAPRRALHVLFARRWVQPHWDLPGSILPEAAAGLDDERRRLLGYGNVPARYDHEARRSYGYGWG